MEEYLRVEDIERIYQIDKETVYRWIKKGRLSAKKIGKRWYFPKDNYEN